MKTLLAATATLCLASAALAQEPRTLPHEPGPGQLRSGEVVLVDDGSCPAGQIKRVAGGGNRVQGTDIRREGSARQVTCIRR